MSPHARFVRSCLASLLVLTPTLALAHDAAAGHSHGFLYGFMHPIGGLDHILAMVAVGIFAATLGGRAFWAVPLTFMALIAVGGALGMAGVPVPFVELGIALSIVMLGVAIAINYEWPIAAAMAVVGVFAIFHGVAHGAEMPLDASGAAYGAGFVIATGVLHLAGIALGLGIGEIAKRSSPHLTQIGGAAVALAGVMVLTGVL